MPTIRLELMARALTAALPFALLALGLGACTKSTPEGSIAAQPTATAEPRRELPIHPEAALEVELARRVATFDQ